MRIKELGELGNRIFSRSIHPLKRSALFQGDVLGFDTEYDSKTHELISWQLATLEGKTLLKPARKMSIDELAKTCVQVLGRVPEKVLLLSYFSLAELQFLDVKGSALCVREFARGSLDVQFVPAKYKGMTLEIFDLLRWFDFAPLKKAAESFGLEKLDYDCKHVSKACLKDPAFRKYALNDPVLCIEIFKELRKAFLEKGVDIVTARTAASASSMVFRLHHVEEEKLYCDKNRARYMACLGTWGGRAEVFERGKLKGIYHEQDIASAYPNAAVNLEKMPVQGSWREVSDLRNLEKHVGGFGRFAFSFPRREHYPCLPIAAENGALVYPSRGETYCTFAEISLAREMGARVRLLEAWGYKKGTPILADYMKECLTERKVAKGGAKIMWKLLANSLIGKFAQRTDRVNVSKLYEMAEKLGMPVDELVEMSWPELRALAGEMSIAIDRFSLGPVWMPEWNGLITGCTRAKLSREIWKKGAVYCHTDSLWTESNDLEKGWDLKGSGRVTIARTRFAALWTDPPKIVHHSVWTKSVAEQMLKKFDGCKDVRRKYPKSRPVKFREAIRSHRAVGHWIEKGETGYWHSADTRWDGKRRLLPDGSTLPWETVAEYIQHLKGR